jgi:hypothetical protein
MPRLTAALLLASFSSLEAREASAATAAETACRNFQSHCKLPCFDTLPHTTSFRVNSHTFQAEGDGDANSGLLSSTMILPEGLADKGEWLAVLAVVGYPTYSEYTHGTSDLFKPSTLRGGYKYERHYSFSNGLTYDSTHETVFDADENRLYGNFTTVNFPEKELSAGWQVRNFVETFMPAGPGVIKSIIVGEWQDPADTTKKLHAVINSTYNLMHQEELTTIHWRHVAFLTEHNGSVYTQSEKLTVTNAFEFGAAQNMLVPPRA